VKSGLKKGAQWPSLPSLLDFAPQRLDLPPLRFAIQPLALSCGRGLGGFAFGGRDHDALNQGLKTAEGFFSILVLGPVLLSFDHNDPVFGNPVIPEVQQALFVQGGEGRGLDIKAQMDGACHFFRRICLRPSEISNSSPGCRFVCLV